MIKRWKTWFEDSRRTFVPLRFDNVKQHYDRDYAERTGEFAKSSTWMGETRVLFERSGAHESRGALLDLGCNTGVLCDLIDECGWGLEYHGLDINAEAIRLAKAQRPDHRFVHFDGRTLPFADGSVQTALFNHSLGHVERPPTILAEVHRVLAPGGRLLIATPNRTFKRAMILKNLVHGYTPDPTVLRYYTARTLTDLLESSGFTSVETWLGGEAALALGPITIDASRSRLFASATRADRPTARKA